MAQVKFYSVSSLPNNPDAGGVFFVDGGELYKGTQRFGANKVFTVASEADLESNAAATDGKIGGDIAIGFGAAKVWDAEYNNGEGNAKGSWRDMGADNAALQSSWLADISTWTSGLVAGGEGSYITGISQNSDGKVTASAAAFPTLATGTADGTLKLGSGADANVNGWDTVKTDISNLQAVVSYSGTGDSVVTATTGSFTNLTVTSTATFSATTVSADTLTVGGTAVNNIAASSATGGTEGVAVTVSTARGGVTDVGVAITSASLLSTLALTDFAGKSVVTAIGPSSGAGAATDTQVPTALAVAKKLATLDNAMHFRDVVASTGAISDPAKGDIVVIGATPASGFVTGQEYIYNGTSWEIIGDQNTYAVNAYTSTASVYSGVVNVPGALNAVGAAADTFQAALDAKVTTSTDVSDTNKASNLVTAGAVAGYVAQEIGELGTAASMNYSTSVANDTTLPTGAAVTTFVGSQITTSINALNANVSSSNQTGLTVSVVETSGVITGVQAELVWLGADGNALA